MSSRLRSILTEFLKNSQNLSRTKQLQALTAKTHLSHDPFYATKLVRFYAMNNDLVSARKVFDETPQRSAFLWNSIIRAYAQGQRFDLAFSLFTRMLWSDIKPDNFTYACVIRACAEDFDVYGLRCVHGAAIVSGLGFDSICGSALVTAYSKCCIVEEASRVFYGISEPDLVLWNTMISGYGCCGFWEKGVELFYWLRFLGKKPDGYTIVGLITGLMDHSCLKVGQCVHGFCLKLNLDSSPHVGSALLSMYSRCKCMNSANNLFSSILQPDLVTWSAMITGYAQCGYNDKALLFFRKLNISCEKADAVLSAILLGSCARLANARAGKEIHGYVVRQGLQQNVMVSSALTDMYSKCGFVGLALLVFQEMWAKNVVSFNSLILGLGLHGFASRAFEKFVEMLQMGLKPDESTFSALLCTCCHSGLVNDGREIFRRMKQEFHIQPQTEHYVYMVKLLGMAGEMKEAYKLVASLREPVDSGVWGALLTCCDFHRVSHLAEIVAKKLFENEPAKSAYRVMLSKVYAGDGKWDEVKKLRDGISDKGARKMPGISWV